MVLVGKGTRLSPFLSGLDKTYTAEVRFGVATDTLDREGAVVDDGAGAADRSPASTRRWPSLTGEIDQVPPIYSALKRDGQALYRLARARREVAAPAPRRVVIHGLAVRDSAWGVDADRGDADAPAAGARRPDLRPDPRRRLRQRHLRALAGARPRAGARHGRAPARAAAHARRALRRRRGGAPRRVMAAAAPASHLIPLGAALPHLPAHTLTAAQAELLQRSGRLDPQMAARAR